MADEMVREQVQVEHGDDELLLREICESLDVNVESVDVRGVDPGLVVFVVGSATMVYLALERWCDRRVGGQVIDLRPGASPVAYRDRGVVFGYVVVYATNGTVEVQVKEPENQLTIVVQAVLNALTEAGTDQVEQITSLIEGVVAGRAEVRSGDADRRTAGP